MAWLWLGVLLWSIVHLLPALTPGARASLVGSAGEIPYRIGFALLIFLSMVLMVVGWRSVELAAVYDPPSWGRHGAMLLVLLAFILFGASHGPSGVKRVIRHPQLTAVILWAIGHLLANGENRSVLLFGALGVWAAIEIVMINRRDGAVAPPAPRPLAKEIRVAAIGCVAFAVFLFAHPYLFGVSPIS